MGSFRKRNGVHSRPRYSVNSKFLLWSKALARINLIPATFKAGLPCCLPTGNLFGLCVGPMQGARSPDGRSWRSGQFGRSFCSQGCNGVQREHNKKLNNGLPILHKVPPKRDYGRYFCIMAEKGGTSHGGLTEKLSLFFHAKKQEVNAYGR